MYNFKKYLVVLYSHKMKSKCGVVLTNGAHGGIWKHVAQLLDEAPAGLKSDGDRDRVPGKPALSLATGHGDHRFCLVSHQKIFVYTRTSRCKQRKPVLFFEDRSIVSQRAVPYSGPPLVLTSDS